MWVPLRLEARRRLTGGPEAHWLATSTTISWKQYLYSAHFDNTIDVMNE